MRSSLTADEIATIRGLYAETHNISAVRRATGHSWRIIAKYVEDMRKRQVTHQEVNRAYRLTGSVKDAAKLLSVHPSTVWRHLTDQGVVVADGAKDAARLYRALRKRVNESQWRQDVLARDGGRCIKCDDPSDIVHHEGYRLAAMRDDVFRKHPEIDPFRSRRQLIKFIDRVMEMHRVEDGETLCKPCHDAVHSGEG